MLDAIFYSVIFGAAIYKTFCFFGSFFIAVHAHYWGD